MRLDIGSSPSGAWCSARPGGRAGRLVRRYGEAPCWTIVRSVDAPAEVTMAQLSSTRVSAAEQRLRERRLAGELERVRGLAEGDLVRPFRDVPLARVPVEAGQEPPVRRQRHLARLTRLQLDPFEAEQPHALVACRVGEVELRDVRARPVAGVGDGEGRGEGVAALDCEVGVGEGRVAEAVAEGVERLRV